MAVNQRDPAAFQRDQRDRRHFFRSSGDQRRGFRPSRRGILRPSAGFADIHEGKGNVGKFLSDFLEQWRFLRTRDRDRLAFSERRLELGEVQTAELVGLCHVRRAPAPDCLRIERHALFATANQKAGLCAVHDLQP